eukprot:CAMPEP_0114600194 /NCGR_PEP_ID=MMETSP0125-20121206/22753_1 /TAXON_ID=485358 ORGANISM="Aristerostoma sp., Strain ATCC 50986" /NCGR_SAMPLE_ID=MMETSP0125 /ASSEMBLY_ACC=CAM_ASM_000245 /LENGTH=276 /DNA_ID=CAMNT_0001808059 /DNA_START=227 /DNA_END=1057 /DNA_ORIENTATION=+
MEDKQYIAKVFPQDIAGKNKYFYENEKSFSCLQHPNIISIVDGEEDRFIQTEENEVQKASVIYMEHAPYGDFFNVKIEKGIQFDEKLARSYFHQLIEGLEAMHERGLAHLDIKLDNLLLGEDFKLKITDFDLSYNPEYSTAQPSKGTANYRAPELRKGKARDFKACDIYSAGVVLFAFHSTSYPFIEHGDNVTPENLIYKLYLVLDKYPEEFWRRHATLQKKREDAWSDEFKELFKGMCAYDPSQRWTIEQVKESDWYKGPVYPQEEVTKIMGEHF